MKWKERKNKQTYHVHTQNKIILSGTSEGGIL